MSSIESKVKSLVGKILKVAPDAFVLEEDLVDRYGMDSMQRVEIVIELEKAFEITISDETATSLRSIDAIVSLLRGIEIK